ncbi:MAG TPA: shikimate kinase [Archaeoglobus profundus]|nr:shikimate kinase [Archaeoglobus profundus]
MQAVAYAAGTIVNALATGYGSAFGLDLKIKVKLSVEEDLKENILIEDGREVRDKVLDFVLSNFKIKAIVEVKSEIPKGCGLGSSSAFMNALLLAIFKHTGRRLYAHEILRLNSQYSLKMGISYTGAFDDASASLLGGIVVTNNYKMELIEWIFKDADAVVLIPEWGRGEVSLEKIRRDTELVRRAIKEALNGNYKNAMMYNSIYYCDKIGYPLEVLERVKDLRCCCGLSGNGPAYVAFGDDLKELINIWNDYGKIIKTKLISMPVDDVIITSQLFSSMKTIF